MVHPERKFSSDKNKPKIVQTLVYLCAGTPAHGGVRFSITSRGEGAHLPAQAPVLEGIERLFMRIVRFRSVLVGGRGQEGGAMGSGRLSASMGGTKLQYHGRREWIIGCQLQ